MGSGCGRPRGSRTARRSGPALPSDVPVDLDGDSVRHSTLGEGVVTRIERDGTVTIRFAEDGAERRLMLEFRFRSSAFLAGSGFIFPRPPHGPQLSRGDRRVAVHPLPPAPPRSASSGGAGLRLAAECLTRRPCFAR